MILTDAQRTEQIEARRTALNGAGAQANPLLELRESDETVLATVTLHASDAMSVTAGVGSLILDGGATWVDHEVVASASGTLHHGTLVNKNQDECGEIELSEITIASPTIVSGSTLRFSAAVTITQPSGA